VPARGRVCEQFHGLNKSETASCRLGAASAIRKSC